MRISYTHTISCGHRIVGHPGDCRMIHGHNYEITLYVDGEVQDDGMVLDYDKIKGCARWLDKNWDHRLLLWIDDPVAGPLDKLLQGYETSGTVCVVPFNPTAENMALYLLGHFKHVTAVRVKEGAKTEAFVEGGLPRP